MIKYSKIRSFSAPKKIIHLKKVYKNDPSPAEFIVENAGITLGGLASPSEGNGTLYINITYRKLKLDSTF